MSESGARTLLLGSRLSPLRRSSPAIWISQGYHRRPCTRPRPLETSTLRFPVLSLSLFVDSTELCPTNSTDSFDSVDRYRRVSRHLRLALAPPTRRRRRILVTNERYVRCAHVYAGLLAMCSVKIMDSRDMRRSLGGTSEIMRNRADRHG